MAMKKDSDERQGTLADLGLKPAAAKRVRTVPERDVVAAPGEVERPRPGSAASPWSVGELVAGIREQVEGEYADVC